MAASQVRSSASPRRTSIRRSTITAARSARHFRSPTICSTSRATPQPSASRPAPMRRSARPPSSPSSASTAPSSACAICWRGPIQHSRSSGRRATYCGQPRASSRSARTNAQQRQRMSKDFDEHLVRFRNLPLPVRVVYGRPRTFIALAVGVIVCWLLPGTLRLPTRFVVGWDVFAALYLVLAYIMMLRCDVGHIRRSAVLQDDGRFVVLLVTAFGALASLGAIVFELGASKGNPAGLILATVTIVLSWTTVHTAFSLH